MSGKDEDDEDFERQLELEEREMKLKLATGGGNDNSQQQVYTDPNDGTVYEWNHEKQAWFPKLTDDFIAAYQASYGSNADYPKVSCGPSSSADSTPATATANTSLPLTAGEKRKANEQQGWFNVDDEHNTNVYISNLPEDITEEEFEKLMSKCGIILKDPATGKLKLKMYNDSNGAFKGDALCCYMKVESVTLALKILDGYELRGRQIHVERAKFQMKGEYDPTKRPKKRKPKEKKKLKEIQDKLLDWRPDRMRGERARNERTVVIKNMFDPKEFEKDASMILEYKTDLREECAKFGIVKKLALYDRHPEGVATVTFEEASMADACITALNGRWFARRQLNVHTWDGKTKYFVQESETQKEERLEEWDNFLEKDNVGKTAK